ncbi:MAG: hypothetical protein AAF485_16000 [Chloroflexota bacterium]
MNFLPTNYQLPKSDNHYLKLEAGDNTFRILSPAVTGWKYWEDANGTTLENPVKGCKPKYVHQREAAPSKARHCWLFTVWNYTDKQVKILELTQNSVMKDIAKYVHNDQWGNPRTYDFNIYKRGEGLNTDYQVTVNPKQKLEPTVLEAYKAAQIDLEAFFRGDDPFNVGEGSSTTA